MRSVALWFRVGLTAECGQADGVCPPPVQRARPAVGLTAEMLLTLLGLWPSLAGKETGRTSVAGSPSELADSRNSGEAPSLRSRSPYRLRWPMRLLRPPVSGDQPADAIILRLGDYSPCHELVLGVVGTSGDHPPGIGRAKAGKGVQLLCAGAVDVHLTGPDRHALWVSWGGGWLRLLRAGRRSGGQRPTQRPGQQGQSPLSDPPPNLAHRGHASRQMRPLPGSILRTCPSRIYRMRSAIWAASGLWVIISTV